MSYNSTTAFGHSYNSSDCTGPYTAFEASLGCKFDQYLNTSSLLSPVTLNAFTTSQSTAFTTSQSTASTTSQPTASTTSQSTVSESILFCPSFFFLLFFLFLSSLF